MLVDYEKDYGFIYVLRNSSLPNWVKVGRTKNVDRRVAQLNTGNPEPFILCKAWVTNNFVQAEKVCHTLLANVRARSGREFFRVPTEHLSYDFEEFESTQHPLDDLMDDLDWAISSAGIRAEDAWHPQLMG